MIYLGSPYFMGAASTLGDDAAPRKSGRTGADTSRKPTISVAPPAYVPVKPSPVVARAASAFATFATMPTAPPAPPRYTGGAQVTAEAADTGRALAAAKKKAADDFIQMLAEQDAIRVKNLAAWWAAEKGKPCTGIRIGKNPDGSNRPRTECVGVAEGDGLPQMFRDAPGPSSTPVYKPAAVAYAGEPIKAAASSAVSLPVYAQPAPEPVMVFGPPAPPPAPSAPEMSRAAPTRPLPSDTPPIVAWPPFTPPKSPAIPPAVLYAGGGVALLALAWLVLK